MSGDPMAMTDVRIDAILLDLDGTLIDTAPDMGAALNALLAEYERPPLDYSAYRSSVSHGAKGLIRLGFGQAFADLHFERLRHRFLQLYARDLCRETRVFDGFLPVLDVIESRGMSWGIVTNKPAGLTEPLVEALGLMERATCVVSGDTCARSKPDPMSLLHAAGLVRQPPERCVYVGDAERDIRAAKAAGMRSLVASYGYLSEEDDPVAWRADGLVDHPGDILEWIDAWHSRSRS
jgi:phosphoglycolate phosphatase